MAQNKDSFILYTTQIKRATNKLNNEQKGLLFQAIIDFQCGISDIEIDDPVVDAVFGLIELQLEMDK